MKTLGSGKLSSSMLSKRINETPELDIPMPLRVSEYASNSINNMQVSHNVLPEIVSQPKPAPKGQIPYALQRLLLAMRNPFNK